MKEILLTSSVLILSLLALRALFRRTISRRVQYALWGLVLARLLVPVSLPAVDFSLLTATEPASRAVETRLESQMVYAFPTEVHPSSLEPGETPVVERTVRSFYDPERGEGPQFHSGGVVIDQERTTRYFFMMPMKEILTRVWYAGMAVMACWLVISNILFWRNLCKARKPYMVKGCKYPVFLVEEGLPSPCLFGLLPPAVYLTPACVESPEKQRHVIAHEITHARHLDPLWALLRGVCLTIYWFHPLVWMAAFASKTDCELACDEGALQHLGELERIPYGQTMLSLIPVRKAPANPLLSTTTMTADKKRLTDRITRIAENRQSVAAALFILIAAVALVCAVTFTGAKKTQSPNTPDGSAAPTDAPLAPGSATPSSGVPLTGEELSYFNEEFFVETIRFEGALYLNLRSQFLSSIYETPEEIDLYELFYCGTGRMEPIPTPTDAELELLDAFDEDGLLHCPVDKLLPSDMDAVLLSHTGLTLEETRQTGLDNFTYLKEYDAYYHMHGDTNARSGLAIAAGEREGDLLHLYYNDAFLGDGWKRVTLRDNGEGGWWFVSNLYCDQPAVPTVYPEKPPVLTIPLANLEPVEPQAVEVEHRSNDCAERLDGWAVGENGDLLVRAYRSTDGSIYAAVIREEVLESGAFVSWEAERFLELPNENYSSRFFSNLFGHDGLTLSYHTDNGWIHAYYTFSDEGAPFLLAQVYGVESQIIDLDGDGNNELLSSGGSGAQLYFQRDGQVYGAELSALLYENWTEMDWWDYSQIDANRRCLTVTGFVDMPEWDKDYLEGAHTSAYFWRDLYFDGNSLLVYDNLTDTADHVAVGAVGMGIPPDVLLDAKAQAQAAYEACKGGDGYVLADQGFDDWRVSNLSLIDRYGDFGLTTEVYSLGYAFHASEPGKVAWAGGMYVDENGWVGGFYMEESPYLVYNARRDGSRERLQSDIPGDCAVESPAFRAGLCRTLLKNGLIQPSDISGEDLSVMLYVSGGAAFFNLLAEHSEDQRTSALRNLAAWYASAGSDMAYRVDDPLQNIFWNSSTLTEPGRLAYRQLLSLLEGGVSEPSRQAQAIMDAIAGGAAVTMTLSPADGVGGGTYAVGAETGNAPNRILHFPNSFHWYATEGGVPDMADSLKIASADGSASFLCWPKSMTVYCTLDSRSFWLIAQPVEDTPFDDSLFGYFRLLYDEAEWAALTADVVIPDHGQSHLEVARAWVEQTTNTALGVTPGSRFACTYVRTIVSVDEWEHISEEAYPAWTEGRERFYFSYERIFVPENNASRAYQMAGNTGGYQGEYGAAPEGAFINYQAGPMYLSDDGWRCEGTGTGP